MPEFKRTFTGGRMEKDLDERMVSNGLYREALNIEIATSEGSDVGAAENILGNIQLSEAIGGPEGKYYDISGLGGNRHIAFVVDQETGMLYRFINTECNSAGVWMDRIIEYDTTKSLKDNWDEKEAPVLIDIYKVRTKCSGYWESECGQWWVSVYENFAQLRPFMAIVIPDAQGNIREDVIIQEITYSTNPSTGKPFANLRMSKKFPDNLYDECDGEDMYFVADRVLNFHPDRKITGINIMDGMIFWTDNYSEPKKINIKRSKLGCQYFINPAQPGFATYKYQHFDQHTRLIVNVNEVTGLGEEVIECIKFEKECPIPGCTDPIAPNYNPTATVDDGSCIAVVYGCTDPNAKNYNHDCSGTQVVANVDDGCCCYVEGCMDPTACNYDPNACWPDGSCTGISGCMDPLATNYNPLATCDDGNCNFLWSCSGAGYGNEGCSNSLYELTFLPLSSYTSAPHKAFEALVDGIISTPASAGYYASSFWWNQSIPSYVYSSTLGNANYYGTQGDCIYPGVSGTWDKKIRLNKLTIGNFLPTSPATSGTANNLLKLFDETLHLGSCIGGGPEDKFLEYFYDGISLPWTGCNWSYGGTHTSQYGSPWNTSSPSFLEILQTRGFGDYELPLTSGAITKKVQVAVLADESNSNGSWEIVEGAVMLRLDKSSGYEWGVNLGGTPPDNITLTNSYDMYNAYGTSQNTNVIIKGWPPPKIDESWAWEDILRVLQSDWFQPQVFTVYNNMTQEFIFSKQEAPFTFDVEIQPTSCICTSWTACACEKDPLNGIYTSEYDCQHDNMNYNTCCSQANAPLALPAGPLVVNPLVTTTTTTPPPGPPPPPPPPPGATPGSLAEFMQVNAITLDALHMMVHELGGPQTGELMNIADEGEENSTSGGENQTTN